MNKEIIRCTWALQNETEKEYHDFEWGKETHDERKIFEMLILEGKQAGLSWDTILKRRDDLRIAFDDFDPLKIVNYNEEKINELLSNPKIIRNKLKVNAVITNAKAYLELIEEHKSLDNFLWSYINFKQIVNNIEKIEDVPASTELSEKISKDLKKLGFKFVGPVIIYSLMQAIGMVNDHLNNCSFKLI